MKSSPVLDGISCLLIIIGALAAPPAPAQLVAYESFESYPAGVQLESGANGTMAPGLQQGYGWGGAWDVNSAVKSLVRVENRSANPVHFTLGPVEIRGGIRALRFYDIANGSPVVRRALGVPFRAASGEDLWFSLLFRTASVSPLANQDLFQIGFDDSTGNAGGRPQVSIGAQTIGITFPPARPLRFFAGTTTSASNVAFDDSTDIAAAATYFLVGRISAGSFTYDLVELFVNPASLTDPGLASVSFATDSGLDTLTHFVIRTASLDNGDAYVIDELKIGRSYAAVLLPEPPPVYLTLTPGPPGTISTLRWPAILSVSLEMSEDLNQGLWLPLAGPYNMEQEEHFWQVPDDEGTLRGFFRLRQR